MPILTNEEEKQLLDRRNEQKKAIEKFKDDFIFSFLVGIRMGGIALGAAIVVYLTAKWVFKWDLFCRIMSVFL